MTKIISKELNEERFDVNNISDSSNNIRGKNKKMKKKLKYIQGKNFFIWNLKKK